MRTDTVGLGLIFVLIIGLLVLARNAPAWQALKRSWKGNS